MAEKKAAATKAATEKKTTAKKACATRKTAATKKTVVINAENVGFRAGDVYQALAAAEKPLSVAEIAKAANISTEEVLLGIGWLFKEGKVKEQEDKLVLA
ncbi:MAG: winged helix-turn-helix domain-containing protein [Prevotella sp.]|nr:winged helix-turn-helix domain-containing protein [Prevotella sp.]